MKRWKSESLISMLYRSSESIYLISNKLSDRVCLAAQRVDPNVKCLESKNDQLYNGMVIVLYPNQKSYDLYESKINDAVYVFKTRDERIHHVLHVLCCVNNEYQVKKWRSSAGSQTIDTHSFMKTILQDVLDTILEA